MKRFWEKHKGSLKYSILAALAASTLFPIYVRVAFFFYSKSDLMIYTTIQRYMFLFSKPDSYLFLAVYTFFLAMIPSILGGIIINNLSQRDIEDNKLNHSQSTIRGILFGFCGGLLISLALYPDTFLRPRFWELSNHFIYLSGLMATLIGAISGGCAGFFIHSNNLSKRLR
jgi:hypothetical protein